MYMFPLLIRILLLYVLYNLMLLKHTWYKCGRLFPIIISNKKIIIIISIRAKSIQVAWGGCSSHAVLKITVH